MDIRAQRSIRLLKEALFECMKEKPFKDIVVIDVTKKAGLNRSTFYKYYKSCSDIIRAVERDQLAKIKEIYEREGCTGEDLIREIIMMLDEERSLFDKENIGVLADAFHRELFAITKENYLEKWKKLLPNATDDEAELAIESFIAGALHAVVNEDNRYSIETRIKVIKDMREGCLNFYA